MELSLPRLVGSSNVFFPFTDMKYLKNIDRSNTAVNETSSNCSMLHGIL